MQENDYEPALGFDINAYLITAPHANYFFQVSGSSMQEAGIRDGDKVAVDRSLKAKSGDIVIAVINKGFTIKRLYRKNGITELRPENEAFKPIRIQDGDDLEIWGVVTGMVRRY